MTPFRSSSTKPRALLFAGLLAFAALASAPATASPSFTEFESGQVRPLALSQDGKLLFAVNTPDNRLEVFRIKQSGLVPKGSIPVDLEPVSVAASTATSAMPAAIPPIPRARRDHGPRREGLVILPLPE